MAIVHLVLIQVKADADPAAVRDVGYLPAYLSNYLFGYDDWGSGLVMLVC
jgi:hypothetical protein